MHLLSQIDSGSVLATLFMPHQLAWIQAEQPIHDQGKRAIALVEKGVRIGMTRADSFKNTRKRIWYPNRDYLFATKDYQSALDYMDQCYKFLEIFDLARSVVSHGEDYLSVNKLDPDGRPTAFTEQVKIGLIKFDNGSRIIAFSSNPQAMQVYGGDVGLDEFAKHANQPLLWETAMGRATWGYDIAVWSSHDGEDTLFNQFAREASAGKGPWNIYFRVTLQDAINNGLVEKINQVNHTNLTREQFLAECRAAACDDGIFEQAYMCNPLGARANHIVEWSAIERCRADYTINRVHLEEDQVREKFGEYDPAKAFYRERDIEKFIIRSFPCVFAGDAGASRPPLRMGFDVAASGQGDLAVFYIDEVKGATLQLAGLLTCRTQDWHFLGTVLSTLMGAAAKIRAAGDASGLGQQICWEANRHFGSRFLQVKFASLKQDLGFSLMNQLSVAEKRFPRSEQDIAADYFALQKVFNGSRWVFTESRNSLNEASHCDIAWAGALSSYAHTKRPRAGLMWL